MNRPRIVRRDESWPENGSMAWAESKVLRDKPILATHPKQVEDFGFYRMLVGYLLVGAALTGLIVWWVL